MAPNNTDFPSTILDPAKWVEPQESFIGRILECKKSDTDQSKTRDDITFTEFLKLPRPKRQWRVVVERLDAVFKNSQTGELSPIKRYMTIDLERYDDQKRVWYAVSKGNNKAYFTLDMWAKQRIVLEPDPAKCEGMVCDFTYLRSKMFGGGTPAKDILYPNKVLALPGKDFAFQGDVEEIEFTPKEEGTSLDQMASDMSSSSSSGSGGGPAPASDMLTEDKVRVMLTEANIDGSDEDAVNAFVAANKAALPGAIKVALVGGDFFKS